MTTPQITSKDVLAIQTLNALNMGYFFWKNPRFLPKTYSNYGELGNSLITNTLAMAAFGGLAAFFSYKSVFPRWIHDCRLRMAAAGLLFLGAEAAAVTLTCLPYNQTEMSIYFRILELRKTADIHKFLR